MTWYIRCDSCGTNEVEDGHGMYAGPELPDNWSEAENGDHMCGKCIAKLTEFVERTGSHPARQAIVPLPDQIK